MNTQTKIFINAQLVDPESELEQQGGVVVTNGFIADTGGHITADYASKYDAEVIDCEGLMLLPGLVDLQVSLGSGVETLASLGKAAAAGGVTSVLLHPSKAAGLQNPSSVDHVKRRAEDGADAHIYIAAAATKECEGKDLTEMGLLLEAGAVAFSNGDKGIASALTMRRLMSYGGGFDALIMDMPLNPSLTEGGQVHEGIVASRYGLTPLPAIAELIQLERNIRLAQEAGIRYHAHQLSCEESVSIVALAKQMNPRITAGVSAQHLYLNEHDLIPYKTFCKILPPLRREDDRVALEQGIADGVIDVIVSAHVPCGEEEKRVPFNEAEFGCIGLETLLSVVLNLWHKGVCSLTQALKAVTCNPADILGIKAGRLQKNYPADVILVDPYRSWQVSRGDFHSKTSNTPFEGRMFEGKAVQTYIKGRRVF